MTACAGEAEAFSPHTALSPRIAYVTPGFPPRLGGVETHVAELALRSAREGWEVDVLSQDGHGRPSVQTYDGIRIRRFPSVAPNMKFPFAPGLFAYLRQHAASYDLLHAHNYHALPALGAALARHPKLVFTPHYLGPGESLGTRALHHVYFRAGRLVYQRAERIVCVTRAEAQAVQRHFGVQAERIDVIPNGINVNGINGADPIPTDARIVLTAGRLEPYKNFDRVIRALVHLDRSYELFIAGDGPALPQLRTLSHNLGLGDRVKFLGHLDHGTLDRWYRTAVVYVSMSSRECFGITLLEAVAGGAAVVAADIPVHREVLEPARSSATLVPLESDPRTLAEALARAGSGRCPRDGASMSTLASLPSWEYVSARTLDIYNSLLSSQRD